MARSFTLKDNGINTENTIHTLHASVEIPILRSMFSQGAARHAVTC